MRTLLKEFGFPAILLPLLAIPPVAFLLVLIDLRSRVEQDPVAGRAALLVTALFIVTSGALFGAIMLYRRRVVANSKRLRESRDMYQSLVDQSTDGIIIFRGREIVFANTSIGQIIGLPHPALVGQDIFAFIAPEHRGLVEQRYRDRLEGKSVEPHYEIEMIRNDGRRITAEVSPAIINYRGAPANQTIIKDITEKKLLMSRLIQANRLTALRELAAGVANQLNNPMVGILNMAQILKKRLGDGVQGDIVDTIIEAAEESRLIIGNLIMLAGGGEGVVYRVDAAALLNGVCDIYAPQLMLKGIQLRRSIPPGQLPVTGSEAELSQVFITIIQNAVEAMQAGGGGEVTVIAGREIDRVAILFRDSGPGFPAPVLDRAFDPYFTTKDGSLGLGLTIAATIIRRFGGEIVVANHGQRGAEVRVSLPLAAGDEASA